MRWLLLLFPLLFSGYSFSDVEYGNCIVNFDPYFPNIPKSETVTTQAGCISKLSSYINTKHTLNASTGYYRIIKGNFAQWNYSTIAYTYEIWENGGLHSTQNQVTFSNKWFPVPGLLPPPKPCETPKTDAQCNKGVSKFVKGLPAAFNSREQEGCIVVKRDGVGVRLADGTTYADVVSEGSTGKSWCTPPAVGSSYSPMDDAIVSANNDLVVALDNNPKNCPNGWVQLGGSKFYCLKKSADTALSVTPESVKPDGSVNSHPDGAPNPSDSGVGKPPTSGGGSTGGGGSGGGSGGDGDGDGEGGGGGKPPARPSDPWASILDTADFSKLAGDTRAAQDELTQFYKTSADGFKITVNKPVSGPMPSYGDVSVGGQKIALNLGWLDRISLDDAKSGLMVLCSLIAAYILLVRR